MGKRFKRKVESRDQKIGNWARFVTLNENKVCLAHSLCTLLSENCQLLPRQELVVSGGFNDSKRRGVQFVEMSPDSSPTRRRQILAVLHARDAALQGSQQINVKSHNTDVFLLLMAHKPHHCEVLWMFSGTARKRCYVPIHQIPVTEDIRESLLAIATRLVSLLVLVKICISRFQ